MAGVGARWDSRRPLGCPMSRWLEFQAGAEPPQTH